MDSDNTFSSAFELGDSGAAMNSVFLVPEGYFDHLNQRILAHIALENFENSVKENGQKGPEFRSYSRLVKGLKEPSENYFDQLSARVFARIQAKQEEDPIELVQFSKGKDPGFLVPEGYFESLMGKIQMHLDEPESRLNPFHLDQSLPFQVPENYFDKSKIAVQSRIKKPNTSEAFIKTLVVENKSLEHSKSEAKSIPLFRRRMIRYAAVACFILFALFGGRQIRQVYLEKVAYPITTPEDRLKYHFGIDESVLEDELISDVDNNTQVNVESAVEKSPKTNIKNDRYLLSHPDSNTLLEEL